MATPTYRQRVAPSLIDAGIPDSGNASTAQALSNAFRSFSRTSGALLGGLRSDQGRREGAEAGRSESPDFRQGIASLTAYGRAYNDAATRSYAIKSEIAADESAARLEIEAGNDSEKFRKTFGAVRDETLKASPPEARAVLGEVYDRRMASSMRRIIAAQHQEILKRDQADVAEGVVRAVDRIAQLRASTDPAQHAQAEEEQVKLDLMLDAAQADGTLTDVAAGSLRNDASRSITANTVMQKFTQELDNPYGDPVGFIGRLREANKTSEALAPDEEAKLEGALLAELRERNSLADAARSRNATEQRVRWDTGNRVATGLLLKGGLTVRRLAEMTDNDEIDPDRASSLYNELQSGPSLKSDPKTLFTAETTLLDLEEDEISTMPGLSYDDRSRLILKRREWQSGWRGTQEGREAADRIDRALGIPPGFEGRLLSGPEKTKRERALTAWYNSVDALPPAERQKNLIPLSEEVITKVIKDTAYEKLQKKRNQRASIEREYAAAASAKGGLSKTETKARNEDLAEFDAQIKRLEQAAK